MNDYEDFSQPSIKKGNYTLVHDRLMELLDKASHPLADYAELSHKVSSVDRDLAFPDYLPVSNAKFAVKRCLGPRRLKLYRADAWAKVSSCKIADGQFFDEYGQLRPEYRS